MSQLVKERTSLVVLRASVVRGGESVAQTEEKGKPSPVSEWQVMLELQATGEAGEREIGVIEPTAPSRRLGVTVLDDSAFRGDANARPQSLAHWTFPHSELHAPTDFSSVAAYSDRANTAINGLVSAGRFLTSSLFKEYQADALSRFARSTALLPTPRDSLPSHVEHGLRSLLSQVLRKGDSLWFELAEPSEFLPVIAWERLLRRVTDAPVLRLSPFPVKALGGTREPNVALAMSVPGPQWLPNVKEVQQLYRAICHGLPEHSTLHLFADDLCRGICDQAARRSAAELQIEPVIHEPPEPDPVDVETKTHPWLTWMGRSLRGNAVDLFQLACPGMLYADMPRVVIAREPGRTSPTVSLKKSASAERTLGFITSSALSDSLAGLGVWAAFMTVLPRGPNLHTSRSALRLIAHDAARARPGVVCFHEFADDPELAGLQQAYRFVTSPSLDPPNTPAITLYCHPSRAINEAPDAPLHSSDVLAEYLKLREAVASVVNRKGPTPAWLAATQRTVEQIVSRYEARDLSGEDEAATRQGLIAALKVVQSLLRDDPAAGASSGGRS